MKTIVIVDDTTENLSLLNGILSKEYNVKAATSGKIALKIIQMDKPDLILLDIMMPILDGYEVCKILKEQQTTKHIPIIFVTAKGDIDDESYGLSLGAVDYIHKPIHPAMLLARINTHLNLHDQSVHLENLVQQRTEALEQSKKQLALANLTIEQSRQEIVKRLGRAAEFRDNETGMHVMRMSHYTRILAEKAQLSDNDVELLYQAAPMHDIGKIGIADQILLKPGPLDEHEFDQMKAHPEIGADILQAKNDDLLGKAHIVALTHHEKWDGSGYPQGLKGEEIPLEGRIVAIADVFDALTSVRPYKKAWTVDAAFDMLTQESGTHFDPALVPLFIAARTEILAIKQQYNDVVKL